MTDVAVPISHPGGYVASSALPEAQAKLSTRALNFYYGEHQALKNINVSLGTHRVTAFIGPSGCGKSTLLRVFNRMYDLYPGQRATGQVMLDHTDILDEKLDVTCLPAGAGLEFRKRRRSRMTTIRTTPFGIRLYEKISKSEMDDRVEK